MAQPDEEALVNLLGDHARDVESLIAENFALQAILLRLAAAAAERPDLRPALVEAFEEAASFIQQTVLRQGRVTEALEVVERMRAAFTGRGTSPPR
jgi:hypothetical protein